MPNHCTRLRRLSSNFTHLAAYWIAFTLLALGAWIARKFGEPSFEQLLYHIQFGADGLIEADQEMVHSFLRNCVGAPFLLAVLAYAYEKLVVTIHQAGWRMTRNRLWQLTRIGLSKASKLWIKAWYWLFRLRLPVILIVIGAVFLMTKISLWSHLRHMAGEDLLATHYVAPSQIQPPASPKRNLILVYGESLEVAYRNKSLFGSDLLQSLDHPHAVEFARFEQAPGTEWTIAGIVASQCGIPLRPVILDPNGMGVAQKFLPNITCLGDVLKANGYRNIFMGGASLSFAGKGKFFENHGYDELWGNEQWIAAGEKPPSDWWGLHDDRLLQLAKTKLDDLVAQAQPFNLTLLTVDNHAPDGMPNPYCTSRGGKSLTDVVRCTSELVAGLRDHAAQKGYLHNTDFIVIGDHLAMQNQHTESLLKHPGRTVFNSFIVRPEIEPNRSTIYHFDIFPSVLYAMGFRFSDNRLGMGISGFGPLPRDVKPDDRSHYIGQLLNYSPKYLEFWKLTKQAGDQ